MYTCSRRFTLHLVLPAAPCCLPAELEHHASTLDQQAQQLAEQLLISKRSSGPRVR